MLLISAPTRRDLRKVIASILAEEITREEVFSWQKGVFSKCGWDIPIGRSEGYWYFYSLQFVTTPFPDDYFLRRSDLAEYLLDMDENPGEVMSDELVHLRSHQLPLDELRWPIAMMTDTDDAMSKLPSVRGTFEKRMDMVEHCHFRFGEDHYLLIKQFDEQTGQLLLLGNNRSKDRAEELLSVLEISDYILP